VGAGITSGAALPFEESKIFGLKDLDGKYVHSNGEPEYILPVEWLETLDERNAFYKRGMFASQHSACKLRDSKTLKLLYERFEIHEADNV
jgi:hypothetical protein